MSGGATFNRVHVWVAEILNFAALNAEFDNILNNLNPAGMDGYSDTVPQMKIQTSPGGLGSESLATSLGGEIERLRYVIQRIIGSSATYWYQAGPTDLTSIVATFGPQFQLTRLISGPTTGNSSQLLALLPGAGTGTAANVILNAGSTPLVYSIAGQNYTISTNQTFSGLSLAPSTNNNIVLPSLGYNAGQWTKMVGQYGTTIAASSVGSSVPLAQIAAFQNGTEVFLGDANASGVTVAWRGCMWNSAGTRLEAQTMQTGATVSVCKLAWLFANASGSLSVTYDNPTISSGAPTGPNTGDYWYNLSGTAWMVYSGAAWATASVVPLGVCAQNTNSCVGARTFDSYVAPSSTQEMQLDYSGTASVIDHGINSYVQVFGSKLNFGPTKTSWNITGNLGDGLSVSPATTYFCYLAENGSPSLTDKFPLQRKDLLGLYHPHETWRCIGSVQTDNSTNFLTTVRTFRGSSQAMLMGDGAALVAGQLVVSAQEVAQMLPARFINQNSDGNGGGGNVSSTTWIALSTISLTPGIWRIDGSACIEWISGTIASSLWTIGLGPAPMTPDSVQIYGRNYALGQITTTSTSFAQTLNFSYFKKVDAAGDVSSGVTGFINYFKMLIFNNDTLHGTIALQGWNIMATRLDDTLGGPL